MSVQSDFDRSISFGQKALELARAKKTPATPDNYRLWFDYVAGEDRGLVDAVDAVLERSEEVDDEAVRAILDTHSAPVRRTEDLANLGNEMSGEIEQVMSHIGASIGTTHAYGDSLAGVVSKISGAKNGAELQSIVETMVYASREMERQTRDMETKLADSQSQIEQLNTRLDEVRTESRTDALTGISNRKHFDEKLAEEIAAANETQDELCLCIGDIDRFKKFNDTYGHQTGDQVLRLVASAMSKQVKGRDMAARYGGEEFAIVLPMTNMRAAVTVANQIREQVMRKELVKRSTGESLGTITISIGVARYRHGEPAEDLIKRADACLYAAKHNGRNQVKCEADPGIGEAIEAA